VQVIEVVTTDHQIYFEARAPRKLATTENLKGLALANTVMYEALADLPGVATVEWTQEPTSAGLLADHVILYVTSDSGESEGVLDFPLLLVTTDYVEPRVTALRAALNATEQAG